MSRSRVAALGLLAAFSVIPSAWGGPVDASCPPAARSDSRCPDRFETGTDLAAEYASTLVSADGKRLFVVGQAGGRDDLSFGSYDVRTGARQTIRRVPLPGGTMPRVWSTALLDHDAVVVAGDYYPSTGGTRDFVAVFEPSGRLRWMRQGVSGRSAGEVAGVVVTRGRLFVTGSSPVGTDSSDAVLRELDTQTGRVRWSAQTPQGDPVYQDYQSVTVAAGRIVAVGQTDTTDGFRGLIDVYQGGRRIWRALTGAGTAGEALHFAEGSPDGKLVAVSGISYKTAVFPSIVAAVIDPVALKVRWRSVLDPGPFGGLSTAMTWSGSRVLLGGTVSQDPQPKPYVSGGVAYSALDHISPCLIAVDGTSGKTLWSYVETTPEIANGDLYRVLATKQGIYLVGAAGLGVHHTGQASLPGEVTFHQQGAWDGYVRKLTLDGRAGWWTSHNVNGLRGYSYERLTSASLVGRRLFVAGEVLLPYVGGPVNTYRINGILLTYERP